MFHKAIKLEYREGTTLELTFQDGKVKRYDMSSLEELNEYYSYQRRIDEAFAARNEKDLNLLKNQFKDFRSSADKSIQAAKQKMLDDWVKNADLGSTARKA